MSLLQIKAGETLYVVYPATLTRHAFEQAETVFHRVWALSGARPILVCDDAIRNEFPKMLTPEQNRTVIPPDAPAILIGDVTYPETVSVLQTLRYGEGEIRFINRRLVIAAHLDMLLPAMVTDVTDRMRVDGEGTLTIDVPEKRVKDNRYLHLLPVYRGGKLAAYREGCDESDLIVVEGTNEDEYRAYCDELSTVFPLYSKREVCGNLFAVFRDSTVSVHAYYVPSRKMTRIVIEPAYLLPLPETKPFQTLTTPQMTIIGRRFSYSSMYLGKDSGAGLMSYVMRLSDGSFLIYDGGIEIDAFADAIWDVMREQAPDPAHIVIAAWIITHSHNDHMGGFYRFCEKYGKGTAHENEVKLERLFFNYPSIADAEVFREAWNIRITKQCLYFRFPDAVFSKLHTGDVFRVRDAEIEVFYTHEDFVVRYISMVNTHIYNECSLVSRVSLGGNTIMMMGDAQDGANNIITAMYGDYLKSDFLQVCHHGGIGGTCALYAAIDPDVAFFSTSDALLPEYLAVRYNNQLVYDQHVKQIFNSAENTLVFPLPYTPTENNIPEFHGVICDKLSSNKGVILSEPIFKKTKKTDGNT